MEGRIITEKIIEEFSAFLQSEEKSKNTILIDVAGVYYDLL